MKDKIENNGSKWIGFDVIPREEYIFEWNLDNPLEGDYPKPDCVFFLEVIEHLYNPGKALAHITNEVKQGTIFIISTPNPFWSVVRIKFFFRGIFPMFRPEDLNNNHHVFTVWPHVLEHLLDQNGFEVVHSSTISMRARFPRLQLTLLYPIKIGYFFLRKLIEKVDKRSKGMSYGIVAVKK